MVLLRLEKPLYSFLPGVSVFQRQSALAHILDGGNQFRAIE